MAMDVEEPGRAEVGDVGELVDGRVGALEVVAPVAVAGRDLVVQRPQLRFLRRMGTRAGRHQEVAVALLVAGAEGERPLHVGADEVVAEDPPPLTEELVEELVEVEVRRHGLGEQG
jgi:hypothetical protein